MKKSTIWMLALVMAIAFFALLFMQVRYMKSSMDMRSQQFDETVKRSLYNVIHDLEQEQTRRYIEQDMIESESRYSVYPKSQTSQSKILEQGTNLSDLNQQNSSILNQERQALGQAKSSEEKRRFYFSEKQHERYRQDIL